MSTWGNLRRARSRRYGLLAATVACMIGFGVVFVASSGAKLTGSTFEGNDGNMVVNTAGHTDWASLAGNSGLQTLVDVPSGHNDNAFGQGSKENDTHVTVVTGEIPPNKDDLTRAYLYNEQAAGSSFLYLAWERAAGTGDAHVDFELNQHSTPGFTASTTGSVTLNRTAGDLLIAYDFGGSGTPTITLFKWDGSKWTDQQDLSSLGYAEAAVNSSSLADVLNNSASVGTGDFGEAAINLSSTLVAAGFSPDTCQAFGSVTVKSRSSGSSTSSELKDFIAPAPIHASNCPTPQITTQTSVSSLNVGQTATVGDSATLSGGNHPTGNVSFQLYSDANCQNAVAGVGGAAAINGSGVATFSGASFTASQAGTYYWGVSYAGDSHNNGVSACGGDNEEVVVKAAHLSITKTPDHTLPVNAGDQIGFTVEVQNTGSGDATGVSLNDTLPAGSGSGVTWAIASDPHSAFQLGSSAGHQLLQLKSSTLPAGADYAVHVTAQTSATECSVYDNSATLTASNASSAGPASAEEVCHPAGIHIVKTADAAQVSAGSPIGFTLTVYNDGSGAAKGVKLSDALPNKNASLSWSISAQGSGWGSTCSITGGVLSCGGASGVTVPAGTTQAGSTFTVHVTSPTVSASGGGCPGGSGAVDNTGNVTTSNGGSGQASASTCIASPGIHIVKTADASVVGAGHAIGFTLTVFNDGVGDATGVKLLDTLPTNAGLSWSVDSIGSGWGANGCSIAGGVLSCGGASGVTVPAGTTLAGSTFTVHVTSATTAATGGNCPDSGVVKNIGTVTAGNGGSDQASASTCVAPSDIHIVKSADAAQVQAGGQIGFTLTVYNDGSGDATGVKLNDVLPVNAGLSWSIASQGSGWASSCAIAGGVLSCGGASGVTVAAGTTLAASTFTVHIVSGTTAATGGSCAAGGGVVNNTGSVTTGNGGSGQSTASTCVQQNLIDLAVTKTGSPNPDTLPGNITWTMVVTNNGPQTATGVSIADPIPAANSFVSATATQGLCTGGAILSCSLGTIAPGGTVTITLVTTPSAAGTVTNTVTVVGNETETNTANNTASASVLVVGPHTPPTVFCVAVSSLVPHQLFVGRKQTLTIHLSRHGQAVKGVRVRITGPKLNMLTKPSNSKGVISQKVRPSKAGIVVFTPLASPHCGTKRLGVTGVFTPPVTG